jgi:phenylalanyl-tRNA synthetase beta chain
VPTWRRDIEIEADLAEEIARVRGYELIPPTLPDTPPPTWQPSPLALRDRLREALVGAGITEVVTYALESRRHVETFRWSTPDRAAAGEAAREGGPITVTNPLSSDHSVLRQALVGSLAGVVSTNARRGSPDVAIFEVGKGYGRVGEEPREWWRLGIALAGEFELPSWNRPGRAADVDDAKGLIDLLASLLGAARPTYTALTDEPLLHPGRSATVTATADDGAVVLAGVVGELHPRLVESWDLHTERLVVAELSIAGLGGGSPRVPEAVPPPRFPAVERDLAVVIVAARTSGDVAAVIAETGGELLADATLFDVYRGRPLADDERSLAFRLRFSSPDRTLTETEVDAATAAIVGALEGRLGARIRS